MSFYLLSSFLCVAVLCPLLARWAPQLRLLDLPDERKRHDAAIPVVGGIAILLGLLLAGGMAGVSWPLAVLGPVGALCLVGVVDDMRGLRAGLKLVAQVLGVWWLVEVSGAALYAVPIPFVQGHWVLGALAVPTTVLMLVAILNALNMIDGLDGLAGGCLAIAALGLASAAALVGQAEALRWTLGLAAALAGFLLWNARLPWQPRARLFLGDAGALGVGALLCWLMMHLSLTPTATRVPLTVALAPFAVPLVDMLVVAFWRVMEGRSPMQADRGHSHHLLLEMGLSATQAVRLIWLTSAGITLTTTLAWRAGVTEGRLLGVLLIGALLHLVWFRWCWRAVRRERGDH